MLNPSVQYDIIMPEKYRPAVEPAGLNFAYLDTEMNKMYRFIKNHPNRPVEYTAEKTTGAIQVILEALHADEAAIFRDLLQKKFKVKNCFYSLQYLFIYLYLVLRIYEQKGKKVANL
jgi:hypothetical protein